MEKVTIKTKSGETKKALVYTDNITEWIDDTGKRSKSLEYRNHLYTYVPDTDTEQAHYRY